MRHLLFFLMILSSSFISFAQQFDRVKMDSLFRLIEEHEQGMGSVSLYQNGEEVYHRAFGFADAENNIRATEKTRYRIGSISKTFTATLIMQLVEEGKLSLDTPLYSFFPELPNADKITIKHLLRHRSGLYNFTNKPDYRNWMDQPKTQEELLNIFLENGAEFEPGEKFAYSNTNYVLLSFIAEKVANKPFADILQSQITEPLQLKHTYFGKKIDSNKEEALSYYKIEKWEVATETDMSIPMGAGGIVSTPADLNTFLVHLLSGKLVSQSSLEQMTTLIDGYGLGLIQMPFYEKKSYGHNGRIDEFYAMSGYFPEEKFSIAYISNGIGMPVNDIMIAALSIYFGKEYDFPEFKPALTLSPELLDQYLGTYGNDSFPLKVTISREENTLIGQATGQASFRLEAIEENVFQFQQAGLELEFLPEEKVMMLRQAGTVHHLKRE
ncbi:serine hydrolase domain-containing protein [Catalinimonas niigatensis]|uniref:serine hydrolase domain-containing protein n=1 Tax=Catalinimonas niigatensis TaxID=1397264 RepID=UPI0026664F88|nr:serine hydrolase domain-containing protein [Catalinimonas niigatensis]WPP51365.1 serine hydrolase domain-containing protein [Catalinimonas niigatensis]